MCYLHSLLCNNNTICIIIVLLCNNSIILCSLLCNNSIIAQFTVQNDIILICTWENDNTANSHATSKHVTGDVPLFAQKSCDEDAI